MNESNRAADDFGAIKKRLAEIAAERVAGAIIESVIAAAENLSGVKIGTCGECQKLCTGCTGACCD